MSRLNSFVRSESKLIWSKPRLTNTFKSTLIVLLTLTLISERTKVCSAETLPNSPVSSLSPNKEDHDPVSSEPGANHTRNSHLFHQLEKVFGQNFLRTYPMSQGSPESEEFSTVEDEFRETLDEENSEQDSQNQNETTKVPILIPSEMDVITELEEDLISSEISEEQKVVYIEPDAALSSQQNLAQQTTNVKVQGRIASSSYFKRSCGEKLEYCEEKFRPPYFFISHRNSHYCRCDKGKCDKFGDCCWTIAKTLLHRNPWKCHRVQHENTYALMISKCSLEFKSSSLTPSQQQLLHYCESPMTLSVEQGYNHLHDLPVYTNKTNAMYRNLYCAACNGIEIRELYSLKIRFSCTKEFRSFVEVQKFLDKAEYQKGKRVWIQRGQNPTNSSNNVTACGIFAPELDPRLLTLTFPEVRYCMKNAIDKCPSDFAKKHPQTAALCNSYTQYVVSRPGFLFKNPHCAECYGLDPKWDLRCWKPEKGRPVSDGGTRITPGAAGANAINSPGLNLLFDFDLGEGGYVGYERTCGENEIWDFLRQKCTQILCQKGYELDEVQGICKEGGGVTMSRPGDNDHADRPHSDLEEPYNPTVSETGRNETFGRSNGSSCFILIVHDTEYTLLPNKTVILHSPSPAPATPVYPLVLNPGDYSHYNSTSISLCARNLSLSFKPRFSPLLHQVSSVALALSVAFLIAHILLFLILPEQQNLPGKNLFSLTLSLFIAQSLFLLNSLFSTSSGLCLLSALSTHYFFLSSFFWMNVMSLDVWRTFCNAPQFFSRGGHGRSTRGSFLYLKYSLYAWGLPAVLVLLASSLDFLLPLLADFSPDRQESEILSFLLSARPLYGHNRLCWITQGLGLFIFFALPSILLILGNVILFAGTARGILTQAKETRGVLKGKGLATVSATNSEIRRLKLYAKLGLIMGVTWVLGFLSAITEWDGLWYAFVLVNGLQGTFIFFGFDAKQRTWKGLRERFQGEGARREVGGSGFESRRKFTLTTSGTGSSSQPNTNPGGKEEGTFRSTPNGEFASKSF